MPDFEKHVEQLDEIETANLELDIELEELEARHRLLRQMLEARERAATKSRSSMLFSALVVGTLVSVMVLFFQTLGIFRSDASHAEQEANELIAKVAEDYGAVLFAIQSSISCQCSGENEGCDETISDQLNNEVAALGRAQLYVGVQANRLFPNSQFSDGHRAMVNSLTQLAKDVRSISSNECALVSAREREIANEVIQFLSLSNG